MQLLPEQCVDGDHSCVGVHVTVQSNTPESKPQLRYWHAGGADKSEYAQDYEGSGSQELSSWLASSLCPNKYTTGTLGVQAVSSCAHIPVVVHTCRLFVYNIYVIWSVALSCMSSLRGRMQSELTGVLLFAVLS